MTNTGGGDPEASIAGPARFVGRMLLALSASLAVLGFAWLVGRETGAAGWRFVYPVLVVAAAWVAIYLVGVFVLPGPLTGLAVVVAAVAGVGLAYAQNIAEVDGYQEATRFGLSVLYVCWLTWMVHQSIRRQSVRVYVALGVTVPVLWG